jgi:hypothetical protein
VQSLLLVLINLKQNIKNRRRAANYAAAAARQLLLIGGGATKIIGGAWRHKTRGSC